MEAEEADKVTTDEDGDDVEAVFAFFVGGGLDPPPPKNDVMRRCMNIVLARRRRWNIQIYVILTVSCLWSWELTILKKAARESGSFRDRLRQWSSYCAARG